MVIVFKDKGLIIKTKLFLEFRRQS